MLSDGCREGIGFESSFERTRSPLQASSDSLSGQNARALTADSMTELESFFREEVEEHECSRIRGKFPHKVLHFSGQDFMGSSRHN